MTVVVAYHAAAALDECLSALDRGSEVTVIDNSSSPEVRSVARDHRVEYIDPGRNLGFGAGVNVALRTVLEGPARDVLLLNPDAALTGGDIDALSAFLRAPGRDRVAAVSPRLLRPDGREQRVAWPFPTPVRAWGEAIGIGGYLPSRQTYVVGAVLLLRWEALRDVGIFDERFFLYAEEADWQRRALAKGWSSAVCDTVTAKHVGGGTETDTGRREALFHASHEIYIRKWHGRGGWAAYRAAACAGAAARAAVLTGERRRGAARRAGIYLRGPCKSSTPTMR